MMAIGDYCTRDFVTVRGDETVRNAAQRMKLAGVGSLVVVKDGEPGGIVTDRDLAVEILCERLDPGSVRIEEITARPLVTVREDDSVRDAIALMRRRALRRLPVIDEKGALVGIVASDDLLGLVAHELSALARAIQAQAPTRAAEESQS
jgi:CBS domain-containing protein